jgi:hypothetical protein
MSFGSISKEAHETIAIAMNRLGASSNSVRVVKMKIVTCRYPTAIFKKSYDQTGCIGFGLVSLATIL